MLQSNIIIINMFILLLCAIQHCLESMYTVAYRHTSCVRCVRTPPVRKRHNILGREIIEDYGIKKSVHYYSRQLRITKIPGYATACIPLTKTWYVDELYVTWNNVDECRRKSCRGCPVYCSVVCRWLPVYSLCCCQKLYIDHCRRQSTTSNSGIPTSTVLRRSQRSSATSRRWRRWTYMYLEHPSGDRRVSH